ncbi:hypothetical protein EG103P3_00004 [Enterococcus phage EG103P3]|nr:hypothetical protein EG103P3_00004 [Enterococcus phage EG103P3]
MTKYSLTFIEQLNTEYNEINSDWSGEESWQSLDSLSNLTFETDNLTIPLLAELINNQGIFIENLSKDDFCFINEEIGSFCIVGKDSKRLSDVFFIIKPVSEAINLEKLFG